MATIPPEVLRDIASRRLNITNQRNTALQQLGQQYNMGLGNLDQYAQDTANRIDDQMSSQGLWGSSIRVDEQGRLQQNVGQRKALLGQQYAQGTTEAENSYTNALQALTETQTGQQLQANRDELGQQAALQQQALQAQQAREQADAIRALMQQYQAPVQQANPLADLQAWYEEMQRQEAERLWNETIWYNEVARQNAPLKEYRLGGGNRVM